MAATLKDVAREAGVALSTASKAINNGKVKKDNYDRIMAAVKKLGYRPNTAAQAMKGKRAKVVAIIVPSLDVDYCRLAAQYVQQYLRNNDYAAVLYETRSDPQVEARIIERQFNRGATGIIALPADPENPAYAEAKKFSIPVVFISDEDPFVRQSRVVINDYEAGMQVIDELSRRGHKRVGIVCGRTEYHVMKNRLLHFRKMINDRGIEIPDEYVYYQPLLSVDAGYMGARYLTGLPEPPTAIVCMNGELLLGAKVALLEMGLKIPEDISLCGFIVEHTAEREIFRSITRVVEPVRRLAEAAASTLISKCEGTGAADRSSVITIEIDAHAVVGTSIADLTKN